MLKSIIGKLVHQEKLSRDESYEAMELILGGQATPAQISSLITVFSYRGIEAEELTGLVMAMRARARTVTVDAEVGSVIDTCGTGGAGVKAFNISTASAIIASSSGLKVAKHGNRSVTSSTGSADVLEALGLPVETEPEALSRQLTELGMCFMYAPLYHQAMRHAGPTRKELGFRSVFNLLGPLTNPLGTRRQVIGVFDHSYSQTMAQTLQELGSEHVLIVRGADGLDEFTISTATAVTELKDGQIKTYEVLPEHVGLQRYPLSDIQVNTPQESAELILRVLQREHTGAAFDIICFNAGAALYVGGQSDSLEDGVHYAAELIRSGQAYDHYLKLKSYTGGHSHA